MPTYLSPGVYVEEVDRGSKPIEGVGTAVAAFVGFTAKAPMDDPSDPDGIKPRLITNWAQFESAFGGFVEGAMLPHAVYGYFNNGGGVCYVCRIPHARGTTAPRKALPSAAKSELETLEITALEDGSKIEVVIDPASPSDDKGTPPSSFTMRVRVDGQEAEVFPDLSFGRGSRYVGTVVNEQSKYVRVKAPSASGVTQADRIPAPGVYALEPALPTAIAVSGSDFEGSETERTGVRGLVIADEVTMVVAPDLVTAATKDGQVDLDMFKAVQTAMVTHCENAGDRMAILDSPPGMSPQEIKDWRAGTAMYDSKFAALYYPWIKIANPTAGASGSGSKMLTIPPSGHLSGIWARNDNTRGVWKAPANEVVRGALDVDVKVTKGEQDLLNPIGINCIRPFGTRGIRVWGARTLSSDPSWRYVNVRRLFNFIEESILLGTQWVVFEPNDLALWQRVKRTVHAFLLGLWRQGALFGATPEQAFYVKCDEETNPPESVDEGKLVVEIGVAPVKPAEFVIFRISQWQGGGGAAE
jgi:Bacteriophage tail sheath protein